MAKLNATKCDNCKMAKSPIIYIRMSNKLCTECWRAQKETAASLIRMLPDIKDRKPPLGYHFVINDWFSDERRGKLYADHAYERLAVCNS